MNMNRYLIAGAIILAMAGGVYSAADIYDATNFSSLGREFQPIPDTYGATGKDNGAGFGMHHVGEDCGLCHRTGGQAEHFLWTMSGTLYRDRAGRSVLPGGEILLEDCEGNIVSMTSNEAGNFWTTAPLASHPYTVSSNHGGPPFTPLYELDENGNLKTPADPLDARTWRYKTWLRKGRDVKPMLTIAGVGANAELNRMTCNMHHAGLGSRGGLWVGRQATLKSYPASGLSYGKHIYPILRSKCSPCHIPGSTNTAVMTKSDLGTPSTSIDFSSKLDLMTYEGSTVGTFVKKGVVAVTDPSHPEESLLLQKTAGATAHAGGIFWTARDADYKALKQWIAEGATKN